VRGQCLIGLRDTVGLRFCFVRSLLSVFMNRQKALERPVAYQEVGGWKMACCALYNFGLEIMYTF
jgi:hypothetical protein